MEFSRQEYWSGQPIPSLADLPDPGIELGSPALQVDSLPTELSGKPLNDSIAHSKTKFSKLHVLRLYCPKSLETEVTSPGHWRFP